VRLVIVESPYAGDLSLNVLYARKCVRDALLRGEAPLASHLLYTQPGILKDEIPEERALGDATVVYVDYGITKGMEQGIANAQISGRPVEYRKLLK
jgi:hypothetical protein